MIIEFEKSIVVVSGLPRSGTSMMMAMLERGGIQPLTDEIRTPDIDNPKGYYEVEKVKGLKNQQDKSWLQAAEGKAIKVVSSLLRDLPSEYNYQVIFMNRKLEEVLASQNKMRGRRGDSTEANDAEMMKLYEQHLRSIKAWMNKQSNFRFIEIDYKEAVERPAAQAERIQRFLGVPLDRGGMANAVDEQLYRNRG